MSDKVNEIDLIEVVSKLIKKICKNKFVFSSVIVIFIFLGFMYNYAKTETFTYSSIGASYIQKEFLVKYINDINYIINKNNKIIPKLKSLSINYDNSFDTKTESAQLFNIKFELTDTTNIKNTISKVKSVLNNYNYISTTINNKKKIISEKIKNYTFEIGRINDIQSLVFKNNKSESTIISTNGLSRDKVYFMNEKIELENEYNKIKVLNIIQDNYYLYKSNKNLILSVAVFIFIGVIFSSLVIILKKN